MNTESISLKKYYDYGGGIEIIIKNKEGKEYSHRISNETMMYSSDATLLILFYLKDYISKASIPYDDMLSKFISDITECLHLKEDRRYDI